MNKIHYEYTEKISFSELRSHALLTNITMNPWHYSMVGENSSEQFNLQIIVPLLRYTRSYFQSNEITYLTLRSLREEDFWLHLI